MEGLVLKTKIILLVLFSMNQIALADDDATKNNRAPKLDNTLNECIGVALKQVHQNQYGVFLNARLTSKQPVSKCGCKSALLSYSVLEVEKSSGIPKGVDPPEWTRIYATFAPFKPGTQSADSKDFPFMIQAAESRPNSGAATILRLSCAQTR